MLRGRDVDDVIELKRQGFHPGDQPVDGLQLQDDQQIPFDAEQPSAVRPRVSSDSKLEPFKLYLNERLRAGVWNARVRLRELRERNYDGG